MTLTTVPVELVTAAARPWRDGDGPPFPFFWFPLGWLLLLAVVVTTAVLLLRRRDATEGRRAGERALAERFAAGTIDADEYRTRRNVLRQKD